MDFKEYCSCDENTLFIGLCQFFAIVGNFRLGYQNFFVSWKVTKTFCPSSVLQVFSHCSFTVNWVLRRRYTFSVNGIANFINDSPSLSGTATYFLVLRKPRLPLVQPSSHSLRHYVSGLWGASTRGSRLCSAPTIRVVRCPCLSGACRPDKLGGDLRFSRRHGFLVQREVRDMEWFACCVSDGFHFLGVINANSLPFVSLTRIASVGIPPCSDSGNGGFRAFIS